MKLSQMNQHKLIEIPYKPHEKQVVLHNDGHRYKVIVCGRRFGKTIFAINEVIKKAIKKPGDYWYIAPTYRQAKLISWDYVKYYAEGLTTYTNEQDLKVELFNGSVIRLMGADNEDSLRGAGIEGVVFDEFADIKYSVWDKVIRPMLLDSKGWAIFMGTPKGKNHFYELFVKDKLFHDETYRDMWGSPVETDEDFKSFRFKTIDNPYIDPAEIEKARRETNPESFRQEFEASFETYAGIIYKEFQDHHIIRKVPDVRENGSKYKYYIGIDTGRSSAVSFVYVDTSDVVHVFDELYVYDWIVSDIVMKINDKINYWGIPREKIISNVIIDSASQVKREFEREGLFVIDSQKDVYNSINRIRDRFKQNQLFFYHSCRHHIFEHHSYVWDEKKSFDGNPKPKKENDHTCNAVQYVLNSIHFSKAREKPITKEDFQRKQIFDEDYEKYEDKLGIEYNRHGQPIERNEYGDSVVA